MVKHIVLFHVKEGVDVAETAVSIGGFIIGLVVLCITQYFAKGVELQEDVDGLL